LVRLNRLEQADDVNRILKEEREIAFSSKPLGTSRFQVENIKWTFVFYEDGLGIKAGLTITGNSF